MPKSPPLSARVPPDLLARLDAYAEREGLKRNAALVALLSKALGDPRPHKPVKHKRPNPKAVLAEAHTQAAHLGRSGALHVEGLPVGNIRAPMPKTTTKRRWAV